MLLWSSCSIIRFLCLFLLPKHFLLCGRAVGFCYVLQNNTWVKMLWTTTQLHVHGPPAAEVAVWLPGPSKEESVALPALLPAGRQCGMRLLGVSPSRLCRQGCLAQLLLPILLSFLPLSVPDWSCPSTTVPISSPHPHLHKTVIGGDSPCFSAPSSLPKCQAQPAAPSHVSDLLFTTALVPVATAN